MKRYYGVAAGRVQGVGFRYFVQQNAQELSLTGWVRNMPDGTVTMEFQGEDGATEELSRRIREGNFFVKVKSLELTEQEPQLREDGFSIRY